MYGITLEEYNGLYEKQGGRCALCGGTFWRKVRGRGLMDRADLDHDHITGENRGLLCHRCNVMLGYARDDIGTLSSAIEYLRKYSHEREGING